MGEQAELLAAGQHLRAEAGGHAKQADADGHGLQPVGDGEAAVKDAQRAFSDGAGGCEFHKRIVAATTAATAAAAIADTVRCVAACSARLRSGECAYRCLQCADVCALAGPQGQVAGAGVAGQAQPHGTVHHHRARLAGVVAPDACYVKDSWLRFSIQRYRAKRLRKCGPLHAGAQVVQVYHRLAGVHAGAACGHGQGVAHQGQDLRWVIAQWAAQHHQGGQGGG